MLTGLYRPTAGRIYFDDKDITYTRPDRILARGMARTFQNIRLFATMSAIENVMVGQHTRMHAGLFGSILRTPSVRHEEREVREKARATLEYVGLARSQMDQLAVNLSYGDQRRVEIARALVSEPHLLLLSPFRMRAECLRLEEGPEDTLLCRPEWTSRELCNDVVSSVLYQDHIYGFDLRQLQASKHRPSRGTFKCLEWATGKVCWSTEEVGHASVLVAGDKSYLPGMPSLGHASSGAWLSYLADAQGSVEALADQLNRLDQSLVKINILRSGVGGITENDITLARLIRTTDGWKVDQAFSVPRVRR